MVCHVLYTLGVHGLPSDHRLPTTVMFRIPRSGRGWGVVTGPNRARANAWARWRTLTPTLGTPEAPHCAARPDARPAYLGTCRGSGGGQEGVRRGSERRKLRTVPQDRVCGQHI
eukprot:908784-Prorocentrum_minimum.AAC.1